MNRILNFRYIFYPFLAFLFAVLLARNIFVTNLTTITIICVFFVAYLVFAIKFKKCHQFILITIFFILGLFAFYFSVKSFTTEEILGEKSINARVAEEVVTTNSYQIVILDNVKINGKSIRNKVQGKFFVSGQVLILGDEISFTAEIEQNNLFALGEFQSYYYKKDIPYFVSSNTSSVTKIKNSIGFFENIRKTVKETLEKYLPQKDAKVAYAILFGDKSEVDKELKSSYSISGIGHLLAISGLHIGLIVSMLFFVLKKFKVKNLMKFFIIFGTLLFYCFLCGFSPSVVRASLMCLIIFLAQVVGRDNDSLNSVGLSGLVILFFKPLYAFDIGFLLSFSSVIFIILFAKSFQRFFEKTKMPKYFATLCAVSLSASLGTLPLIAWTFNTFSLLMVVANLLAVPVFTISFILVFISTPLVLISSIFSFGLSLAGIMLQLTTQIANFFANISFMIVTVSFSAVSLIFVYYLCSFIFSAFVNLRINKKFMASFCVLVVCVLTLFQNSIPLSFVDNSYSDLVLANASLIATQDNKTILIEKDNFSNKEIREYLNYRNIQKLDVIVLLKSPKSLLEFRNFAIDFNIEKILCSESAFFETSLINLKNVVLLNNEIELFKNVDIEIYTPKSDNHVVVLDVYKTKIMIYNTLSEVEKENLIFEFFERETKVDILVGKNFENADLFFKENTAIINGSKSRISKNINLLNYGNFTFNFENDNIEALRTID